MINDSLVSDKKDIAQHFNSYFQSVFGEKDEYECLGSLSPMNADFISYQGVLSMLLTLKTKSGVGPDKIPNIFLRRYAETLARFLTIIFQTSFITSVLPNGWLLTRVVPVFKKGDPLSLTNYSPMSLTCTVANSWSILFQTSFLPSWRITTFYRPSNMVSERGFPPQLGF